MPKILYFITQSEFGGAQRYVFDLANNLRAGFQVAVALGEQGNNGKLAKILDKPGIKYFIIPHLKRSVSPLNEIIALFEIIKLIKNYQPDIIHLNSSKISILGSLAALFTKSKIVYTVHGWVFNEPLPAITKWFYLQAEKLTARLKDKIICVSEFDRQTALKYKIAPAEKLATIRNGLAPLNFYPKQEAQKIISGATGHDLRITSILIGSIGNLYKTKGFAYFIEAANIVINNTPTDGHLPVRFIIIGEGGEKKHLKNLIKKYNFKNNLILAGRIEDAAQLLNAFDIFVCSSVKEGLPYSILEAMQAGLPIVSTDIGGIPEMIEDKKTGLLVKPANAHDLAEKIITLLNNKTLATQLGQQAKITVREKFGLARMVEETKKMYLN